MAKNYKVQKKKSSASYALNLLFKILVFVAVVIFAFIIYQKSNFSSGSLSFGNVKKSQPTAHTPSELKWFDDFRGVENVPSKKEQERREKNGGGGASSGFKFQGLGK